jgi:SAM-dependent methyltransferase
VSDTPSTGPEHVELCNERQIRAWQQYDISGIPQMISSMNLCHALLALANSGILERLNGAGPCAAETLLEGIDPHIGPGFLRYLTVCGVLDEWRGTYRLTPRGQLQTSDVALARLGFYLEAYGPVTRQMTGLLTGTAKYGVDVTRASGPLSRHSGTVSNTSYVPIIHEAMRGRAANRLLDLGCGDGSLLTELCRRDPHLTAIGIDIAPEAIDAARHRAASHGVADRVEFAVADAFDPASWPAACRAIDVICGVGVLHERFRDGDGAVIDILNAYAGFATGQQTLLIGEPELRYDNRANDSDFFLVHVFTAQGIPRDRAGWLGLFDKTALRCVRVYTHAVAGPRTCFYELTTRDGQRHTA